MRKPFVSSIMKVCMAIQSVIFTAVLLGLLSTPTSFTTALKLNGTTTTTTTTPNTPGINGESVESELPTTVASFLQPDISETTLIPQRQLSSQEADELTATPLNNAGSSSPLGKRQGNIDASESFSTESDFSRGSRPQRNGTGAATANAADADEDGEQSASLSSSAGQTTAELLTDDEVDNVVPNTTDRDDSAGEAVSASANSLGNLEDGDSLSFEKDESDAFSAADDDDNVAAGGGEVGDTIFPPEENDRLESDESGASTTFASLVRPSPSVNPQTLLSNKMNKNGSGRIGTRGLSSKSVLNAISLSASANNNSNSNNNSNNKANSGDRNSNASEVTTVRENSDNDKDRDSNFSSSNFDLNGSTFYSRSNADYQPTIHPRQRLQPEQLLRARPTSPVINHSNSNHNNNLHNRIIKRKRISLGRDSSNTTGGSSLSSIYGNSILTSTVSSKAGEEEVTAPRNVERAWTAVKNYSSASTLPTIASSADSLQPATGLDITTESNSLLNASHSFDRHSQATHYQRSSPPSISGGDESSSRKNLTIPVTPLIHSSNDTNNNNASAPLSSSRAILGFGTSSLASAGKVKRPKPIIMRDHEDSLYNNNVSENAAGTTYENSNNSSAGATPIVSSASEVGFVGVDETATFGIPTGIVDEESNKPVGSNALPTPPYKIRRVKLNSRRTSPRPITDYTSSSSFITTEAPATTQGLLSVNNSRTRLTADAPGEVDYRPMQSNVIRPSSVSSNERPIITSRRVFKEEFGITHNAYSNDHEDDDHHQDNDDDLLGTTEFFSQDSSTPAYPIPMGVRHAPDAPTESEDNTEETESFHGKIVANNYNRNSGGGDNVNNNNNNRYRDYYSQIRFPTGTSDYGNEGGNLHFVSDSPDLNTVSSVTVTVTHTVVHTTPRIVPTSTFNVAGNDEESSSTNGDSYHDRPDRDSENGDVSEKESHPNLHPTPALPPSILASPTASVKSAFNDGEGPPISVSHSVEDVHVSTSRLGVHSVGLHSSQHAENDHNDHDDKGNDQEHKQEHNGQHNEDNHPNYSSSSVIPYPIQPTPVVTTKAMKSVYSTEVKHPHFSSSSYEFTTSSMYSYTFPDHDSMHMTDHDDEDDHTEQHHPEDNVSEEHEHPSSPQPEHSPEVNSNDTAATATTSFVTSLYGKYFTTSPSVPQFWDGVGSTKSSTSQLPTTTLQAENGEGASTPTIDIDIYPPVGTEPSSKAEVTTTETPTTTTSRPSVVETTTNQIQIPGSLEDNNLSEEELKKQQQTTTLKPPKSSGEDVSESDKNKSEEASSSGGVGDISNNGVADNDNDDHQKTKEYEGGGVNFESGDKNDNASTADKASNEITTTLADEKTPFGIGESFGIGTVHVLIMVKIELDVAQTVFCAHLTNFKAMIVTVYETQKNVNVSPDQIVFYTKLACDSKSTKDSTEDHNETGGDEKIHKPEVTSSTRKPGASSTGKLSDRTTKGTVPLTSPPSTTSQFRRTEDGTRKSRAGKDFDTTKNLTVPGTTSSTLNKNFDEISSSSNKSVSGENALLNKSFAQPLITRSRRSTKMAASPAVTKNANMSEDNKASVGNMSSADEDSLLSVYFYLNNKNGSYDQELTSNFVRLWNDSSRLTSNTSNGENNNAGNGQSDNNHSNDDMFFKRVKKVGMITASSHLTSTQSSDENSGIIVAITVASIVAVCLFLLGVGLLIMRHRQSETKFAKRCTPVTLDDYSLDNISVYNSFRRKQRLRGSKRSYTNAAFDDANAPSRPLNASALATALTEISALESEFRAIPNVTATLDDIPNGAETKNRYANVIPMPDTRVLLTFQEDVPNSDYINANYVRGVNGEQKRYIITQGPLEDTVVDFWSLVWQQQVRVILMLTDFAEGGITKCAEYYPRSETIDCSQLHGDFQITLEKRDISDNCITSYLVLKDMERNLRRDIIHFWYHSWPEKGVPASPKKTIDFLNRSRKFTKEPTPVLVHCSPGTGRSGTIVACDIGMKEYDSHNKIDIPRLVMKIRQDRAGAVQTKEQYVHIYEVLHSYASRIGATQLESI